MGVITKMSSVGASHAGIGVADAPFGIEVGEQSPAIVADFSVNGQRFGGGGLGGGAVQFCGELRTILRQACNSK